MCAHSHVQLHHVHGEESGADGHHQVDEGRGRHWCSTGCRRRNRRRSRRSGRDQVLIHATLKLALLGDAIVVVPSIAEFVEQGLLSLIGLGGHALGVAVT